MNCSMVIYLAVKKLKSLFSCNQMEFDSKHLLKSQGNQVTNNAIKSWITETWLDDIICVWNLDHWHRNIYHDKFTTVSIFIIKIELLYTYKQVQFWIHINNGSHLQTKHKCGF